MKKIIALTAALALIIFTCAVPVFADDTVENFTYLFMIYHKEFIAF